MIDIKYLQELLEIFDASSVNDLKIEQEGVEIRLSKSPRTEPAQVHAFQPYPYPQMPGIMQGGQPMPAPNGEQSTQQPSALAKSDSPAAAPPSDKKYHELRSPIVGTFYAAASPDTPQFVTVGQTVTPGMVLCIVEAMKLMNEIECDCYGTVAKILVENAQPVEYNQVLFLIEQE